MATRFRQATVADLPSISAIIEAAVSRMLDEGKQQWSRSYPADTHIYDDIIGERAYVLERDGSVAAYAAIVFTGEPAYDHLTDGLWSADGPYAVIHRMAVSPRFQQQGTGALLLRLAENMAVHQGATSMRIDTNFDNDRMLRLLDRCGYTRCGLVTYPAGQRIAFDKLI